MGKSYTMNEMKQIVEYLVEHRVYNEVRGRKMWMDFASSSHINRTWQSLKETFLKRILPDIHNPYYNLSVKQISSFRQGYDVEEKHKYKLEVKDVSEGSTSAADNEEPKKASTCKNIEENLPGENIQCSKVQTGDRSSTETLVLENCYENAESIQRDLESPSKEEEKSTKSLRDFITYSEPLTPMLQEVLDDFATDEDEPQLQIVEDAEVIPDTNTEEENRHRSKTPTKGRESPNLVTKNGPVDEETTKAVSEKEKLSEGNNGPQERDEPFNKPTEPSKIKSLKLKKTQKGTWVNKNASPVKSNPKNNNIETNNNLPQDVITCDSNDNTEASVILVPNTEENQINSVNSGTENCSSTTTDTIIPDNQEGLKLDSNPENAIPNDVSVSDIPDNSETKSNVEKKKSRKNNHSPVNPDSKQKLRKDKNNAENSKVNENNEEGSSVVIIGPTDNDSEKLVDNIEKSVKQTEQTKLDENTEASDVVVVTSTGTNEHSSQAAGPSGTNKNTEKDTETNPCLKSVSLYAEQFSQSKYSDSENDTAVTPQNKPSDDTMKTPANNNKTSPVNIRNLRNQNEEMNVTVETPSKPDPDNTRNRKSNLLNDIVLLHSHSDSDSDIFMEPTQIKNQPKKRSIGGAGKSQREQALASIFGFSSGIASRKRSMSYRDRSNSHRYLKRNRTTSRHNISNIRHSGSCGASSSSDSDHAPCCKRNGHSRRIKEPKSYDILSNQIEGGLFVVGGKRLYELVKKDGPIENYLCLEESDPEEMDSYWKSKYLEERNKCMEEKIRADEMARLLKRATEQLDSPKFMSTSPILQSKPTTSFAPAPDQQLQKMVNGDNVSKENELPEPKEKRHDDNEVNKTVKIKFTKNNEIELECQWPHVNPVLEKMALMFQKNAEPDAKREVPKEEATPKLAIVEVANQEVAKEPVVEESAPKAAQVSKKRSTSVVAEPIDPEVHARVSRIESEIFKEIEEREKEQSDTSLQDTNVTNRKRGKPKKSLSSEESAPSTVTKTEPLPGTGPASDVAKKSAMRDTLSDAGSNSSKRRIKPTKKYESDSNVRTTKPRLSRTRLQTIKPQEVEIPDDSQFRYKFPDAPPSKRVRSNSNANVKKSNPRKLSTSYSTKTPAIFSSPENTSMHSIGSSQGYQDSDASPPDMRRKRKFSISSLLSRGRQSRRTIRRKSLPYLGDDDTNEANQSCDQPMATVEKNSSLDTEVYRSESYQLLVPKTKGSYVKLNRITEDSYANNEIVEIDTGNLNTQVPITVDVDVEFGDYVQRNVEENSSIVSLPISPELSLVENISISKDLPSSLKDHPTINEINSNNLDEQTTKYNKYLMSQVDVSVPLMEQECELHKAKKKSSSLITNDSAETLPSNACSVNLEEQSSSDSLDQKLRDLLLESARKMAKQIQHEPAEQNMEVDPMPKDQRKGSKKRCSTPRKKKDVFKTKILKNVEPLVEEEHMESCSYGGRKSCPPAINVLDYQNIDDDSKLVNDETIITNTRKTKRKKDVIKVKILRPKDKSIGKENKRKKSARLSVITDSTINDAESGVFLLDNDSIDLIHHHSDTCLRANECIGDSIEYVENESKSIISLDSNSGLLGAECNDVDLRDFMIPDFFCNNAQDATTLSNVIDAHILHNASGGTVFQTPLLHESFNSLITEDMSDGTPAQSQSPPTKWYLLSDEETTNNFGDALPLNTNLGGFGANLNQIFPVTYAIPDLSSITEMSTENDSRKPTLDSDNAIMNNSPSLFDNKI